MLKCFRGHFFFRFISPTVLCMCQCLVHSSNDGGFLASVCTQQFETCKINFEFKQSWSEAYVGCKQNVCSKSCPFAFVLLFFVLCWCALTRHPLMVQRQGIFNPPKVLFCRRKCWAPESGHFQWKIGLPLGLVKQPGFGNFESVCNQRAVSISLKFTKNFPLHRRKKFCGHANKPFFCCRGHCWK